VNVSKKYLRIYKKILYEIDSSSESKQGVGTSFELGDLYSFAQSKYEENRMFENKCVQTIKRIANS